MLWRNVKPGDMILWRAFHACELVIAVNNLIENVAVTLLTMWQLPDECYPIIRKVFYDRYEPIPPTGRIVGPPERVVELGPVINANESKACE